jgi:hypothetical protein
MATKPPAQLTRLEALGKAFGWRVVLKEVSDECSAFFDGLVTWDFTGVLGDFRLYLSMERCVSIEQWELRWASIARRPEGCSPEAWAREHLSYKVKARSFRIPLSTAQYLLQNPESVAPEFEAWCMQGGPD